MNHFRPHPVRSGASSAGALAIVLHGPGDAEIAANLAASWRPAVPTAAISILPVPERDPRAVAALLAGHIDATGLPPERLVLVGAYGTEMTALQLALGPDAPAWAGALVCGTNLPQLAPCAPASPHRTTRLRLIWEATDPLLCADALGETLRRLRGAGLDAQGSVLGWNERDERPTPALLRLGGAYLAELIATALGAAPR